jgi:hypothetical protein
MTLGGRCLEAINPDPEQPATTAVARLGVDPAVPGVVAIARRRRDACWDDQSPSSGELVIGPSGDLGGDEPDPGVCPAG